MKSLGQHNGPGGFARPRQEVTQSSGPDIRRMQLQGALAAGGNAQAKFVLWNGSSYAQGGTAITVYSYKSATGGTGDQLDFIYKPDSHRWEAVEVSKSTTTAVTCQYTITAVGPIVVTSSGTVLSTGHPFPTYHVVGADRTGNWLVSFSASVCSTTQGATVWLALVENGSTACRISRTTPSFLISGGGGGTVLVTNTASECLSMSRVWTVTADATDTLDLVVASSPASTMYVTDIFWSFVFLGR